MGAVTADKWAPKLSLCTSAAVAPCQHREEKKKNACPPPDKNQLWRERKRKKGLF